MPFSLVRAEYDLIGRFSLLDDRLEVWREIASREREYFLDLRAYANKNLSDLLDDAKEAEEKTGQERTDRVLELLRKHNRSEQAVFGAAGLGTPLPRFKAFGVGVTPAWAGRLRFGALFNIASRSITRDDILEYVDSNVPEAIRRGIANCALPSPGEDVIQNAIDNGCLHRLLGGPLVGRYFFPADGSVPQIFNYQKMDFRFGPHFRWNFRKRFFSAFHLYWHQRADVKSRITLESLDRGEVDLVDIPDKTQLSEVSSDFKFGYRKDKLFSYLSLEEVKLKKLSDESNLRGKLIYGRSHLWRWHTEYQCRWKGVRCRVYGGVHRRDKYDFADGLYAGGIISSGVFSDGLALSLGAHLDREHLTFSSRLKLWALKLEGLLKSPIRSDISGVKPSTLWGVNLRLSL